MSQYCLLLALLILLVSCQKQESSYYFKEYDTKGWLIPVRIGEETYDFLFDTGCTQSSIKQELVNKFKLQIIDSVLVFIGRDRKLSYYNKTEKLIFNIADVSMSTSFNLSESNIIGMDIINKYHWMFDRSNMTFHLQEEPNTVAKLPPDMIYKKKYHFNKMRVPIVELLIDDTISIPLIFDSGNTQTHIYQEEISNTTLFPIITLEYNENINDNGFLSYIYSLYGYDAIMQSLPPHFFLWLDSVMIDDLPPSGFYMPVSIDSIYKKINKERESIGTLTWHFISQFRTFYIDPENQEFTFIVSPQDSNIIRRVDTEDVDRLKKNRKIKFIE